MFSVRDHLASTVALARRAWPGTKVFLRRFALVIVPLVAALASFYAGHFHGARIMQYAASMLNGACPLGAQASRGATSAACLLKSRNSGRFVRYARNNKVIVFVHGIMGTATDTWQNSDGPTGIYWPDLAATDERLNGYDIFVASYHSPQLGAAPNIFELSSHLIRDLEDNSVLPKEAGASPYDEVVFICHSMGNLIVRTAMLVKPTIAQRTPLLLSLGAPSEGSALADLVHNLTPQFKDLVAIRSNSFLSLLNTVWQTRAFDTEIACAYEMRNYPGLGRRIVEQKSATRVCTRNALKGLPYDHATMVKPGSREHPAHDWMVGEITKPRTQKGWELPRWADNQIVVGAKDHTESNLHAAMMILLLRQELPELKIVPRYMAGHASRLFNSLKDREIDIYPEYDGTLMHEYLGDERSPSARNGRAALYGLEEINQRLSLELKTANMRMLPHFGFHNPYVLVVSKAHSRRFALSNADGRATISKLKDVPAGQLRMLADQEFRFRKDGWVGLREHYGLAHARYDQNEHASVYERLQIAHRDPAALIVGVGFGTDPALFQKKSDLLMLDDDLAFFPYYHPAPLLDARVLRKFPRIEPVLLKLQGITTAQEMAQLIANVTQLRAQAGPQAIARHAEIVERAARELLVAKGLLNAEHASAATSASKP